MWARVQHANYSSSSGPMHQWYFEPEYWKINTPTYISMFKSQKALEKLSAKCEVFELPPNSNCCYIECWVHQIHKIEGVRKGGKTVGIGMTLEKETKLILKVADKCKVDCPEVPKPRRVPWHYLGRREDM